VKPQGNGSAPAEVYHPVGGVRAPVVDANDHPAPGDLAAAWCGRPARASRCRQRYLRSVLVSRTCWRWAGSGFSASEDGVAPGSGMPESSWARTTTGQASTIAAQASKAAQNLRPLASPAARCPGTFTAPVGGRSPAWPRSGSWCRSARRAPRRCATGHTDRSPRPGQTP